MVMETYQTLLLISGILTVILGAVHFFFPLMFDFRNAIVRESASLKPLRFLFIRYNTRPQDVYGLVWVMNHAASFAILTVGILDILSKEWIRSSAGPAILVWIALWWLLRAGSQLYLGRRKGDWAILAAFTLLAVLHLGAFAALMP